ncbi:helix-turn-helix transcriptional regulator [Phenylobacterium sp.]|uniref:helix-turn-helix domain-containing protein n=1 Tax=Phenylobacterium sp. TaxID=1871053 RepID=UPI002DEA1017|nr:helix-turn-helix transcriptional regulator [Phenylobacterium sp.]
MLLAAQPTVRQSWRMAEHPPENTDRLVWGQALRALRKRHGRTVNEAAQAFEPERYTPGDPDKGVSVQRWSQIEKGNYRFSETQRARLAKAAGGDLEEFELERARILGHQRQAPARELAERTPRGLVIPLWGRAELAPEGWKVKGADVSEASFNLEDLARASIGATHLADDLMQPKADAGALVIFDRARRPALDKGCVVETLSGELWPRIYAGEDADHVIVRSVARPDRPQAFRRADVRGVYAVRFWGD